MLSSKLVSRPCQHSAVSVAVQFGETQWVLRPVFGSTLEAVAETIAVMAEAAETEWFPSYVTTLTDDVVSDAAVTVNSRVTMPQWEGYSRAMPVERGEWDRFFAALRMHEQGHLDLVVQRLSDVDTKLVGLSSQSAAVAWEATLEALAAASDAYDAATDHGRNQGTVINTNP